MNKYLEPKHMGKTFRSASEAFRDADYATPIWRCESKQWHDFQNFMEWLLYGALLFGSGFGIGYIAGQF